MAKPKLAVVILHFGEPNHTLECMRSVADAAAAAQNVCLTTTYIVDNNALTEPLQWRDEDPEQPKIIRSSLNLGFASGMNLGIHAAIQKHCDYFKKNVS